MLLNPKPAGQHANAAIRPALNSHRQHRGSHDAIFVVGFCGGDLRLAIKPTTIELHNENTRKRQQKLHSSSAVA